MPILRAVVGTAWIAALFLAGCQTRQEASIDKAAVKAASAAEEARAVAETSLGKQAEILAQGNLALNGREQLLVVNRFSTAEPASKRDANLSPIFVTRATVLEKNDGKWSQILLCDEHLKNPNGYLGGSPKARVTGWRLEFQKDRAEGLEMKFTPAEKFDAVRLSADQRVAQNSATFDVRWNKIAKRYQSFDQSHERYLSEVPSLETPESILR